MIVEALSTSYGRKKLLVDMWFPMERYRVPGETEEQRVERLYAQLVAREKQYQKEDEQRKRRNARRRDRYQNLRNQKNDLVG